MSAPPVTRLPPDAVYQAFGPEFRKALALDMAAAIRALVLRGASGHEILAELRPFATPEGVTWIDAQVRGDAEAAGGLTMPDPFEPAGSPPQWSASNAALWEWCDRRFPEDQWADDPVVLAARDIFEAIALLWVPSAAPLLNSVADFGTRMVAVMGLAGRIMSAGTFLRQAESGLFDLAALGQMYRERRRSSNLRVQLTPERKKEFLDLWNERQAAGDPLTIAETDQWCTVNHLARSVGRKLRQDMEGKRLPGQKRSDRRPPHKA
jgi:hypothetical protein